MVDIETQGRQADTENQGIQSQSRDQGLVRRMGEKYGFVGSDKLSWGKP